MKEIHIKIRVVIEKDHEEDLFVAHCPDLQAVAVEGKTVEEVKRLITDAAVGYVLSLMKHGDSIPIGVVHRQSVFKVLFDKLREKLHSSESLDYIQDLSLPINHAAA